MSSTPERWAFSFWHIIVLGTGMYLGAVVLVAVYAPPAKCDCTEGASSSRCGEACRTRGCRSKECGCDTVNIELIEIRPIRFGERGSLDRQ